MCELGELDIKILKDQQISQQQILKLFIKGEVLISSMIKTTKCFYPGTIINHKNDTFLQILTLDPPLNLKNKLSNPLELYRNDDSTLNQFVGPLLNIKNYTPQILSYEQPLKYSLIVLKKCINFR